MSRYFFDRFLVRNLFNCTHMKSPYEINFGDSEIRNIHFEWNDCIIIFYLPQNGKTISLRFFDVGLLVFETDSLQNVIDVNWFETIEIALKNDKFKSMFKQLDDSKKIKFRGMKVVQFNCIVGANGFIIYSDVLVIE